MSNDPKDPLLLDHNYDGIQELDNQLPRWWVWLFYITIIYSAVYLVYYHVTRTGDLQTAEYDKEIKAGNALKTAAMGNFESSIPSLLPSKDGAVIESGRQIYVKFCAPCHRADGGGPDRPRLSCRASPNRAFRRLVAHRSLRPCGDGGSLQQLRIGGALSEWQIPGGEGAARGPCPPTRIRLGQGPQGRLLKLRSRRPPAVEGPL